MNQEVKNVFTPGSTVSFKSATKISSYLVRAKVYPLERKIASDRCYCWKICLNIEETDTFTSTITGESFKIHHKLNCDDNCLIYLLTCKCCVVSNMKGKQLMSSVLDRTITKATIEKMHGMKHIYKNIYFSILKMKVIVVFLEMFP